MGNCVSQPPMCKHGCGTPSVERCFGYCRTCYDREKLNNKGGAVSTNSTAPIARPTNTNDTKIKTTNTTTTTNGRNTNTNQTPLVAVVAPTPAHLQIRDQQHHHQRPAPVEDKPPKLARPPSLNAPPAPTIASLPIPTHMPMIVKVEDYQRHQAQPQQHQQYQQQQMILQDLPPPYEGQPHPQLYPNMSVAPSAPHRGDSSPLSNLPPAAIQHNQARGTSIFTPSTQGGGGLIYNPPNFNQQQPGMYPQIQQQQPQLTVRPPVVQQQQPTPGALPQANVLCPNASCRSPLYLPPGQLTAKCPSCHTQFAMPPSAAVPQTPQFHQPQSHSIFQQHPPQHQHQPQLFQQPPSQQGYSMFQQHPPQQHGHSMFQQHPQQHQQHQQGQSMFHQPQQPRQQLPQSFQLPIQQQQQQLIYTPQQSMYPVLR